MQGESSCPQCPTEDDMREGDLGDGMGARSRGHHDHLPQMKSRGKFLDFMSQSLPFKGGSERSNGPFSWTSCRAMYAVFREELEAERAARWEKRQSESSSEDTSEELQRRLQEVTEEVELLRTELEVTHRHLEGKHEALRILQGQAILDKATCHTKILLQKSEESNKALEKEVNALQWEITFNKVQFKNVENSWSLKYERVLAENEVLKKALEEKLREHQEQMTENACRSQRSSYFYFRTQLLFFFPVHIYAFCVLALSQKCLELLSMLSAKERRDYQRTQPPCSRRTDGSALELAVYGACQCNSNGGEPCSCARSAAASRKQVLQLKQELEEQQKRKEEAYVMMDAFRIAFEQQLRRVGENVLRQAETARHQSHYQRHERGKQGSLSVGERLKKFLPITSEGKISANSDETLHMLLDLLKDKEEALAHQRKVSYMLAQNTKDLEKRLHMQLEELDLSHIDSKTKTEASEESEWSRGRDRRCSADLTVPDSPAADDEQTSKPNQPSTEIREAKPDNKDV
ncbi:coiled-coil domain-containing protein 125-like isoform X1 [Carassius auratus]|uniref:Coiled-coil domain-containing protein 125-like isoform X1 n=1 Tax=Carassius auratus TaxID=7957 RepID=A0A6P6NVG4_CARAU|nr:coiled-coil domain-containing protein 125-like isoform X1 [Carassius auratus]XP_026112621.1 coiled-coil domain-containing protein 125-like isoform X1 [Carassius auratus]